MDTQIVCALLFPYTVPNPIWAVCFNKGKEHWHI